MELLEYKILLEKYFEGSSSLGEEKELKNFLQSYNGNDIELNDAKQLFGVLSEEKAQATVIELNKIIDQKPTLKIKRFYSLVSGIAASLIIGLSLLFLLKTNNQPVVYAYINGQPIINKEIAIQYSKQALLTISTNLNKGTKSLNYMSKINKPVELLTAGNACNN